MSSICKGITKKNKPCTKITKNNNGFCSFHSEKIECCICYENNVTSSDTLSCQHSICSGCIGKLRKLSCPMCREQLSGKIVTTELKKKIENNENEDYRERTNNNLLAAIEATIGTEHMNFLMNIIEHGIP
jgi:hypothetical protein